MNGEVRIYSDEASLAQAVAQHVVTLAVEAIASHKVFTLALTGGSTPRLAYEVLATPRFAQRVDWSRVHLFWGDERCVPPDHERSNYRMAREALVEHLDIPAEQVHRMRGEIRPEDAASEYASQLEAVFGDVSVPRFDLVLLGLGEDGHVASLFPGTGALEETERWVVAHYVAKVEEWRLTLTPPVLNAAENVAFLVSGERKREILREVLEGPYRPEVLPAQLVHPVEGRLRWFVDRAAIT
ncbi:MAG: 6-phosphogluconolactonase [Anaerolineae bacterium]